MKFNPQWMKTWLMVLFRCQCLQTLIFSKMDECYKTTNVVWQESEALRDMCLFKLYENDNYFQHLKQCLNTGLDTLNDSLKFCHLDSFMVRSDM